MKKVFFIAGLCSLSTFTGKADTIIVYGSGGATSSGGMTSVCPRDASRVCAKISSSKFAIGSDITVSNERGDVIDKGVITKVKGDPSVGGNVEYESKK